MSLSPEAVVDSKPRTRLPRLRLSRRGWVWLEVLAVTSYLTFTGVALWQLSDLSLLWFDEFFTMHLAQSQSPAELWRKLANGADNNPPLSYLLTSASFALFGLSSWALRFPSIVAGLAAGLCLYLFVRRRRGAAESFLAMVASQPTMSIWIYFIQARPYGLMMAFTAASLLAWQRATEPAEGIAPSLRTRQGWRLALAMLLVLGIATHYFFAISILALMIGELVRSIVRLRVDYGILAAFVASGLALAAFFPLWDHGRKMYIPNFWAKGSLSRAAIEESYRSLYNRELLIPVVLGLMAGVVAGRQRTPSQEAKAIPDRGYPPGEAAALAALAAGAALGVVVGTQIVGAYYYRYTLPTALGLAAVLAFALGRAGGPARWCCLVPAAAFLASGPAGIWSNLDHHFRHEARELTATIDFLDRNAPGVVVVESWELYPRLAYHGAGRGFEPAIIGDPVLELKRTRSDTVALGLQALSRLGPYRVFKLEELIERIRAAPRVYYFGQGKWQKTALEACGFAFAKVAEHAGNDLYRVTAPTAP